MLRWKFREGDTWRVKSEQTSEVASTIGNSTSAMTLETGMDLAWNVETVSEDGAALIRQRFAALRMKLEMPKVAPISYDSKSQNKPAGDAKAIAQAVQPLLDSEVKITLSARGEILKVDLDEQAQKALEALAANDALKGLLSKEGMSGILRQAIIVLPENEVSSNDQWSDSRSLDTPFGTAKQTTTYRLLAPDEKSPEIARIEAVSELEIDSTAANKPSAVRVKQNDQRGLVLFDVEAGRLRSAELNQEFVTASSFKNKKIEVKLTSRSELTLEAE